MPGTTMIAEIELPGSVELLLTTAVLLLSGTLTFLVVGYVLGFIWPSLRKLLAQSPPSYHAASLLLFAVTPAATAATGLMSAIAVSQSAGFNLLADHCHQGPAGFSCAPHLPASTVNATLPALTAFSALLAAGLILVLVLRGRQNRRICRNLDVGSRFDSNLSARVVQSRWPFAFCLGVFARRIYVSQGLVDSLTVAELEIVLDHERNHAMKAHSALLLLFGAFASALPAPVRTEVMAALRLVLEHQSDRFAADSCGDHLAVADVLIKLRRLQIESPYAQHLPENDALVLSIAGGALDRRIAWMIDPASPCERRIAALAGRVLCYGLLSALMVGEALHLALEICIDRLVG